MLFPSMHQCRKMVYFVLYTPMDYKKNAAWGLVMFQLQFGYLRQGVPYLILEGTIFRIYFLFSLFNINPFEGISGVSLQFLGILFFFFFLIKDLNALRRLLKILNNHLEIGK